MVDGGSPNKRPYVTDVVHNKYVACYCWMVTKKEHNMDIIPDDESCLQEGLKHSFLISIAWNDS